MLELTATPAQATVLLAMVDAIAAKTLRATVALTAARGRGKSAALGMSLAAAVAFGYSNIFVTSPHVDNLNTLFEFLFKALDKLKYEEHVDYELVQSTNPAYNKAVVRVNIFREHRQTIQCALVSSIDVLFVDICDTDTSSRTKRPRWRRPSCSSSTKCVADDRVDTFRSRTTRTGCGDSVAMVTQAARSLPRLFGINRSVVIIDTDIFVVLTCVATSNSGRLRRHWPRAVAQARQTAARGGVVGVEQQRSRTHRARGACVYQLCV